MKILITNLWLDKFAGTEQWCYSVATELKRRGHQISVYTPIRGEMFKELVKSGINFSESGNFDLILDNHNQVDIRKFSGPVIHTCHGIVNEERPNTNAKLNVAISEKVASNWKLDRIIKNGIDTNRFKCIKPLNYEIQKVLSLCRSDTANDIIKTICNSMNVDVECMYGREIFNIEDKINEADIVVGVGRSLLDAMSCGRPVVSFDDRFYFKTRMLGYGYITPDKFSFYEKDSFTANSIGKTLTQVELAKEIFEKYNKNDGEVNRQYIVENLSITKTVDAYLDLAKTIV